MRDGRITDEGFKEGIQNIIISHGETWRVFQDIGMALEMWSKKRLSGEDQKRVWKLADETNSTIREAFENWKKKMFGKE